MQTIAKALQAFMRPIGPFPFHPMRFDYTETCMCGEDRDLAGMMIEHDPFHWVHTLPIREALAQIKLEEAFQRHAALFGP